METPLIAIGTVLNKRQTKINHIGDVLIPPVLKGLELSDRQLQVINEHGGEFQRRLATLFSDFVWECWSPHKVIVNYNLSLEEMIASGKYDGMFLDDPPSREMAIKGFSGVVEETIYLIRFPQQYISTHEVLGQLRARHLRPANLPELLALGAQHPKAQMHCSINALGTMWENRRKLIVIASLSSWITEHGYQRRIDESRFYEIHSGNSYEHGDMTDYFAVVRE